jgi:hypothetical protein
MSRAGPRYIATLLLLTYGWVLTCGFGLHGLAHESPHTHCDPDSPGPEPLPAPPSDSHADCPVCDLLGQAQQAPRDVIVILSGDTSCSSPIVSSQIDRPPLVGGAHPRGPPAARS